MSAKILQALTDDNQDLQKQIGCMTGIFQLFDRQQMVTGRRIGSHKRLPSGYSRYDTANVEAEEIAFGQQTTEKFSSNNAVENQRISVESSRTSVSSSTCSSSFSSIECNKNMHTEPLSTRQTSLPPKILLTAQNLKSPNSYATCHDSPSVTPLSGRQFLRDVVKDSIYNEKRGLSVKLSTREEPMNHVQKFKDSPRPLQPSETTFDYGFNIDGRVTKPLDLNESLRVLAKLKDAPWYTNDTREPARSSCEVRDGSLYSVSKGGPRFSYDGREQSRSSFDSREIGRLASKLQDRPRLSLDSREFSMRNSNLDLKSKSNLKELPLNRRPTSVVAKLMGLEAMPSSKAIDEELTGSKKSNQNNHSYPYISETGGNSFPRSSKLVGNDNVDQTFRSPKGTFKAPVSPQVRSHTSGMKPISKFPLEPAPWRQQENGQSTQKPVFRHREAYTKPPTSPSVYSEIEKRLQDLEFKQSNKDLRALKQILEAMQAKGLLETRKNDNNENATLVQKNYIDQDQMRIHQNSAYKRDVLSNYSVTLPTKKNSSRKTFDAPIVIMKPAKLVEKSGIPPSIIPIDGLSGIHQHRMLNPLETKRAMINNRGVKNPPNLEEASSQVPVSTERRTSNRAANNFSPKLQIRRNKSSSGTLEVKENTSKNSVMSSLSPRLQQRRAEMNRRYQPKLPDSKKSKRQVDRQQPESPSPGGRSRPTGQNDEQMSEVSSERRYRSHCGDEISIRSDSNASLASQVDIEVTSALRSEDITSFEEKESFSNLDQEGFPELTTVASDQPSPVSVLDASFYKDDLSPSPMKNVSSGFEDDGTRTLVVEGFDEDGWKAIEKDQLSDGAPPNFTPEINHKKLASINLLVQKLRRLNSSHDEATTDHIASLCENKNPDHRYISEILLASGLILKNFGSDCSPIQLHPSGYPVSPELYLVLEQIKSSWTSKVEHADKNALHSSPNTKKLHRKLVFDTVNEILVWKLALGQAEPWMQNKKLTGLTPSGHRLLRELCSEIDSLCPSSLECGSNDGGNEVGSILKEDVMSRTGKWTDFGKEIGGIVLDIERSIFKDLVSEVVNVGASDLHVKSNKPRRQLFAM